MTVGSLGYVALNVVDLAAWEDMATRVLGTEIIHDGANGAHLRFDEYHHRMTLTRASEDSIAAVGWEVQSPEALEKTAEALTKAGRTLTRGTAAECAARKVRGLYKFHEDLIGVPTEIYFGPLVPNTPMKPSRAISGYTMGSCGLGHIVFWVKDLKATVDFYTRVLGFKISDYIAWDDNDAVFLHCNPRHHTLAVMAEKPGCPGGTLHHIMLEAKTLDDVGYGYDIVRDAKIPLLIEMGKHTNDHMQSFYFFTPSGFCIEYGYGARQIGANWEVKTYDQPMLWGHRLVEA